MTQANVSRAGGYYCIKGLPSEPKSVMATTAAWDTTVHVAYGDLVADCDSEQLVITIRRGSIHVYAPFNLIIDG